MKTKPTKLNPSPNISGLREYSTSETRLPIDLFLHANEGIAPPDWVFDDLSVQGAGMLSRYPDYSVLEKSIGDSIAISPEQILLTAGGDDAIDRACRAYLGPGKQLVLPSPSFEMFEIFAKISGGDIRRVPWPKQKFPVDLICKSIGPETGIVVIVSPNNPTGAVITADELITISNAASKALVLLDLAYIEFADEDITSVALALPNVVIVRTLSKGWGLAGLRVGFAAGPKELIQILRIAGAPYPVSSVSLALAQYWMQKGQSIVDSRIQRIRRERQELSDHLKQLKARPFLSQANFVFAEFTNPRWIKDALAGLGIAVRYIFGQEEFNEGLRISCPCDKKAFSRLCNALSTACAPEAIFFELDGSSTSLNADNIKILKKMSDRSKGGLNIIILSQQSKQKVLPLLEREGISDRIQTFLQIDPDSLEQLSDSIKMTLKQMNVTSAWFIGSRDDHLQAVKTAGILPLAILTDQKESQITSATPQNAIAARTLTCAEELEELLP